MTAFSMCEEEIWNCNEREIQKAMTERKPRRSRKPNDYVWLTRKWLTEKAEEEAWRSCHLLRETSMSEEGWENEEKEMSEAVRKYIMRSSVIHLKKKAWENTMKWREKAIQWREASFFSIQRSSGLKSENIWKYQSIEAWAYQSKPISYLSKYLKRKKKMKKKTQTMKAISEETQSELRNDSEKKSKKASGAWRAMKASALAQKLCAQACGGGENIWKRRKMARPGERTKAAAVARLISCENYYQSRNEEMRKCNRALSRK